MLILAIGAVWAGFRLMPESQEPELESDVANRVPTVESAPQPVVPLNNSNRDVEVQLSQPPTLRSEEFSETRSETLPSGDGYNAWANGEAPPAGYPLQPYMPPGGQVYTIDPNDGRQFMPSEGGVILVPVPTNTNEVVKPTPRQRAPKANVYDESVDEPILRPLATPKPMITPPQKNKPANRPADYR